MLDKQTLFRNYFSYKFINTPLKNQSPFHSKDNVSAGQVPFFRIFGGTPMQGKKCVANLNRFFINTGYTEDTEITRGVSSVLTPCTPCPPW